MHPERGGVEPLAVGLAEAADAAEVAHEAQRRARVGGPRDAEQRGHVGGRGRAGHDLEEEVDAGVARRGVRQRLFVLK